MASNSDNLKKLKELNASAALLGVKQGISNRSGSSNNIASNVASGAMTGVRGVLVPDTPISGVISGVRGATTSTQQEQPSTVTPISDILKNYNWSTGNQYLTPDSPLVQPVQYNNEFSPEITAEMSNAIYNQYYAPLVAQQQKLNTQAYRDAAQTATAQAGAAGMATGSRGAIQAMNQANREAQDTNLTYQLQQQQQAFQDTINARKIELDNKVEDYKNAWEEVAKYGYVVSDKTGQLLGIQPGQQLTSIEYKTAMSNIAKNVAEIEADKVKLAQNQQQLDISRQANEETQRASIYNRLVDMLSRYETVTPEMAALGAQVGMAMNVGDYTTNYMSAAEITANKQNQTEATDTRTLQQIATEILPTISKMGGVADSAVFAKYIAREMANGTTAYQVQTNIRNMTEDDAKANGIGNSNAAKNSAINIVNQVMGAQGSIIQSTMSDTDRLNAIKQLYGEGLLTGNYLGDINAVFNKSSGYTNIVGNATEGGLAGAATGAAIGSIIPGLGTAVGGAAGGILGSTLSVITRSIGMANTTKKAGSIGEIAVTNASTGSTERVKMPSTLTGFNNVANDIWGFGTGDRQLANQFIRETFYDANGNLRSQTTISY